MTLLASPFPFADRSTSGATRPSAPDLGIEGAPALVFQPAVDLATGRILGFEALLRWDVPGRGSIPPSHLIPWAEDHGHMTALNAWVLSEACAQAVRWESNLQVAVNCSVFQLRKHEAARAAAAALEASGLNPDRLSVEVTESTMGDDGAVADLRAMGRLGVQITVDDMASDWSIMRKLADLAVSTMKIDGSLVERLKQSDTENRARVETLIDISHSLGLCVVAEWVETEEQVSILRELDADVGQGYYFSPPLSAEEALELSAIDPPAAYPLVAVHGAGSATEAESPAEQWSQEPESHTEQWSREPESPGEPEDRTSGMPDRARFEELAEILGRIDDHLGRLTESLASLSEPPRYGF